VDNKIRLVLLKYRHDGLRVRNVIPGKAIVRQGLYVLQTVEVRGIRELIDIDEQIVAVARHEQIEKVRADESGTTGDENFSLPVLHRVLRHSILLDPLL
jgi:hypothetical protein